MNMLNPFHRQQRLYEKKSTLLSTVKELTSGKKKYVTVDTLKQHMGVSDDEMDQILDSAFKANRHTNKYTFTTVDGEPAIGIAKAKRNTSTADPIDRLNALQSVPRSPEGDRGNGPGGGARGKGKTNLSDPSANYDAIQGPLTHDPSDVWTPVMESSNPKYVSRKQELCRWSKRHGIRGLMKAGGNSFPKNFNGMNEHQIIKWILAEEFAPSGKKPTDKQIIHKLQSGHDTEELEKTRQNDLEESYSGAILPGRNYFAEKLMEASDWAEAGFDLTDISASSWKKLLDMYNIPHTPRKTKYGWVWSGNSPVTIWTANDPITGKYIDGGRGNEKDYASYIGISGDADDVKAVFNFIKTNATGIKDSNPRKREWI